LILMALTLVLFFGSAVAIYICCEFFVNGVEWVGHRLRISETATGTILAAFGTALPESVVTFVAVAFGNTDAEREIGVGAALGGPLALSTLAYSVVGLTLMGSSRLRVRKKEALEVDCLRLSRDQGWFLSIFVCKLTLGLVAFPGKWLFGFVFLAAYAAYVWTELRRAGEAHESNTLERLKIRPHDPSPSLFWAGLQTGVALVVIFFASRIFVGQLDVIGPWLGLPPQLVALLFSPIATEMPETMNAIIWVRQGKTKLALANISGSMMIQATVPSGLGLLFTAWKFDGALIWSGLITIAAIVYLLLTMRAHRLTPGRLTVAAGFYGVFAVGLVPILS
jgi:cation:H+ antiporter